MAVDDLSQPMLPSVHGRQISNSDRCSPTRSPHVGYMESVLAYDNQFLDSPTSFSLDGNVLSDILGLRELMTFRKQMCQFFVGLFIALFGVYMNCVIQAQLEMSFKRPCFHGNSPYDPQFHNECTYFTTDNECRQHNCTWMLASSRQLPDLGYSLLPNLSPAALCPGLFCQISKGIADWWCVATMITTLIRFGLIVGPFSLRWTVLRRWFTCTGVLFLIRGISIALTVLPNPSDTCLSTTHSLNPWIEAFNLVISRDVTCTDVLYSGHTVNITLCCLVWMEYAPRTPVCPDFRPRCLPACCKDKMLRRTTVSVAAWLWAAGGYISIIATHFHYSVDVWLGFWLTIFVWQGYVHAVQVAPFHAEKRSCGPMRVLFIIISWLEKHAVDHKLWHERQRHLIQYDGQIKRQLHEREAMIFSV